MAQKVLSLKELESGISELLISSRSDADLRKELEIISKHRSFPGLTWLWGPPLYRRNRVLFRPLILAHFSSSLVKPDFRGEFIEWKGTRGRSLQEWLEEADSLDDVELFRRLFQWKITRAKGWGIDSGEAARAVVSRFKSAETPAKRVMVLSKFDLWFALDEASAMDLYRTDRDASKAFILRHLPRSWWDESRRAIWQSLRGLAGQHHDEELSFALYRRQVRCAEWQKDAISLCGTVQDPARLNEELEKRHPEGYGIDPGDLFAELLKRRGRDVLPYVKMNLHRLWYRRIWQKSGYEKLVDLAREKGWLDLWGELVRVASNPAEYNREIKALLDSTSLGDSEIKKRLLAISGISREVNFPGFGIASVKQLDDANAVRLYERFPGHLSGPFKMHIMAAWGNVYPKLLELLFKAADEPLIDFLASRALTRSGYIMKDSMAQVVERLAAYYENLRPDSRAFGRRVCEVLGQVPAYAIYRYDALIRENRLARLLFERSFSSYLDDGIAFRNLIEAPEIHVQLLAYRVLGLDDPRAGEIASENIHILMGTLLRPLQRATRIAAFKALLNAAAPVENAMVLLRRAREALDLPDIRYPKEQLVGLIGALLAKWPSLRKESEEPMLYTGGRP
ncbi:MAG: gliding motility protein [Candidatus Eremiobacteraeota bacterium]|nr:gliding motility protein [Candidatus Eremiobacteraeota bacterium]